MNQREWFTLFLEAKERYPGMILLVRDGDAYHTFGTDAETIGSVCGLCVLPGRWAGLHVNMLEGCLRKLLQAGHRVAICDQIQPLECRGAEVNRIVAPGQDSLNSDGRDQGQPKTLAYIGKGGIWKQTPWMFD